MTLIILISMEEHTYCFNHTKINNNNNIIYLGLHKNTYIPIGKNGRKYMPLKMVKIIFKTIGEGTLY